MKNNNSLTTPEYWNNNLKFFKINKCSYSEYYKKFLDVDKDKNCIEIGAFPGKQLGYLAKEFHYLPTALDFVDNIVFVKKNLEFNNIFNCKIIKKDFLKWKPKEKYDVVCSHGFVEHFQDYDDVIKKHIDILKDKGILIITIPYLEFFQLWLRKILYTKEKYKQVMKTHNLEIMNLNELNRIVFKKYKMTNLFSGHISKMRIWFQPNKETINMKRIKIYKLAKKLEGIIEKMGISNRLLSPEIMVIAKK